MAEIPDFIPPSIDSQYLRVHPSNIPPDKLAEMRAAIEQEGAWEGRIMSHLPPTGAVEIIEPSSPSGPLKIMPGAIEIPRDHPSRRIQRRLPGLGVVGLSAAIPEREQLRKREEQENRDTLNAVNWNEHSHPIYGPDDIALAVPKAYDTFSTFLQIQTAKLLIVERSRATFLPTTKPVDIPNLTARLVTTSDEGLQEELLRLLRASALANPSRSLGQRQEGLRKIIHDQVRTQTLGPTESTPRDAAGQEVCGYATVFGYLAGGIGVKGPGSKTHHLVIFTTPSENSHES